jgi:dienelactone hydrolase
MLLSPTARADYSQPGSHAAGWTEVTVTRPDASTFTSLLFYPAVSGGQNAPFDGSGAPYAGISFGHGFTVNPNKYQSTLEHLATWGYLVMATTSYTGLFPNHAEYAEDLRHCLTYLEEQNADSGSTLYGQVDTAHFGLSGHSMGGGASILAAADDARVKALANLAAAETNPSAEAAMADVLIPARLIAGDEDGIVPSSTSRDIYLNGNPRRQFGLIQGGYHCGFLDSNILFCDSGSLSRAEQLAVTRRLLTEFFGLYLKGDQIPWRAVWGPERDDDPLVELELVSGIGLGPNGQSGTGYNGLPVSFELMVANEGSLATGYTLLAEENLWPADFSPSPTGTLSRGDSAAVTARITSPEVGTGPDSVLVSARSDLDGGTRAYIRMSASAIPFITSIGLAVDEIRLSWPATSAGCTCRVYRDTTARLIPSSGTLLTEVPEPGEGHADEDPGVVGDPLTQYYYLIRAVCGGQHKDSVVLGEFDRELAVEK